MRSRTRPSSLQPLDVEWGNVIAPPRMRISISIDHNHCHRYAICQQEAPEVFNLSSDGRLSYDPSPDAVHQHAVRQAARVCPMQAIKIEERGS